MNLLRCRNCGHKFSGPQVDRAIATGQDRGFLCETCSSLHLVFIEPVMPAGVTLNGNDYSEIRDKMFQESGVPSDFYMNTRPQFYLDHSRNRKS